MQYWLVKTEPKKWSWQNQLEVPYTHWDGVRNYQASNNLKAMSLGDQAFFYHSVEERSIVGIVEVSKLYYPDPSDPKGRFGMVDFKAIKTIPNPVTLETIKAHPDLQNLGLIRQSRLSVMPIDSESWKTLCNLGGL